MFSQDTEILRRLRLIERLKAEVVAAAAELYRAVADNSAEAIRGALAGVVISCFVLGKRLGVDFAALDDEIVMRLEKIKKQEPEAERWFGDYSACQRHWRRRGE